MHCAIDRSACSQAIICQANNNDNCLIICIANNSEIINCNNNNAWLVAAAIMKNSYCGDRNSDNVLKLESTSFPGLEIQQQQNCCNLQQNLISTHVIQSRNVDTCCLVNCNLCVNIFN